MFSAKSALAATAAFTFISSSAALYDPTSKANVAVYWGNGANQQDLKTFCDESSIDIIPIGFINTFPDQGNGLIGENFGNKCWGGSYYPGPGNDPSENALPTQCPDVQEDIPYCQSIGKKVLLSLGGGAGDYALTGVDEGIALADFLWGAYGPYTPQWVAQGGIRPLDRGYYNTSADPYYQIDIDGFDFDIELPSADAQAGYIALIDRLRERFTENTAKTYIISGAPQCPLQAQNGYEDANMGNMIQASQFDIIWIQFYNNDQAGCTARNFADANPNYPAEQSSTTTLNYAQWKNTINSGASAGAKIYIGLLGGPQTDCTASGLGDFVTAKEADNIINAFGSDDQFGGIMIYDATSSLNDCDCGTPYFVDIKNSLNGIAPPSACPTVTSTTTSASSTSSSSSSSSSSTSSAAVTTTTTSSSSVTTSSSTDSTSKTSSSSTDSPSSQPTTTSSTQSVDPTGTQTQSSSSDPTASQTSSSSTDPASQTTSSSTDSTSSQSSASSSDSSSSQPTSSSSTDSVSLTSTDSSSSQPTVTSAASSTSSAVVTSSSSSSSFPTQPPFLNSTSSSVPASTGSSSGSSSGSSVVSGTSSSTEVQSTTSTVFTTSVYTVTSCAATVTDCPARIGSVTTETIALYTTVCPVTETQGNGGSPTSVPASQPTSVTQYTTSTVYTTYTYTITSCAATVTDCPARIGSVTTEVVELYTTVCPVANETPAASTPIGSSPASQPAESSPARFSPSVSVPAESGTLYSTTTIKSTVTQGTSTTYVTLQLASSTAIVVPVPQSSAQNSGPATSTVISTVVVPYPTPSPQSTQPLGTGTAAPTVIYSTVVPVESATGVVKATPTPSEFEGAAGRVGGNFGVVLAVVLGAAALML